MKEKKYYDRRTASVESPISEVLKTFLKQNTKLSKGLYTKNIKETWQKVMGPGVNSYTSSITLKGSTVYVSLTSSIIRSELSYGRQKMITMLNEELGENIIKDIVLR
ncbi:DUF721 domain-containing protein [Flavobacterium agricola]|uniref:DUF721 domain-containing protein n=1 Tax=Flavobacterium agricola TaxID=2870839 RepID=A0ABY6LWT7_9FLAO|nr:DUF721 domain-containing protein [Flavobacterium agricola]UYW00422.1 DUF721 domain-containing protein [Flavobacterium agricola]